MKVGDKFLFYDPLGLYKSYNGVKFELKAHVGANQVYMHQIGSDHTFYSTTVVANPKAITSTEFKEITGRLVRCYHLLN